MLTDAALARLITLGVRARTNGDAAATFNDRMLRENVLVVLREVLAARAWIAHLDECRDAMESPVCPHCVSLAVAYEAARG